MPYPLALETQLWHYINDTLLIGPNTVSQVIKTVSKHLSEREWTVAPHKIQGPSLLNLGAIFGT